MRSKRIILLRRLFTVFLILAMVFTSSGITGFVDIYAQESRETATENVPEVQDKGSFHLPPAS